MKAVIAFFSLWMVACTFAWAKDPVFSFQIPDSLKKGADAVVLFDHTTYIRSSKSGLTEKLHKAVTILSDRADEYAEFILPYDPFSTYKKISCTLYDASGKIIRKVKKSEIKDYSAYDGFSLYHDNRLLYFTALNPTYPYTIELEYEIQYSGFLALSTWYPVSDFRLGVKEATLTLEYPLSLPIQYKEKKGEALKREEVKTAETSRIVWSINYVKPTESEHLSPRLSELVPSVSLAPLEFSFDKTDGSTADWETLGQWDYSLQEQKYELTDATKQQLDALKLNFTNKRELAKQVYQFMQGRTRYVSIQLGIGGHKPFSPELVDEVGYGDCKALSFYTKALLNYVGIHSEYTIIGVNDRKIEFLDFPSLNQTNHVILCVPFQSDTVWLECTSQSAPFNYLFNGTTNRKALLITSEGGKMVKTPAFNPNVRSNRASISLQPGGDVVCTMTTRYKGSFYDNKSGQLKLSDKELRERTLKESNISDIALQQVKMSEQPDVPELALEQTFTTRSMASKAGSRLIVELSPFLYIKPEAKQKSERKTEIEFEDANAWDDEVTLLLPNEYQVEHLPQGKTIETDFGTYRSEITATNAGVTFKRTLTLEKGRYAKERYPDFIAFINQASDADQCKVVLKNK